MDLQATITESDLEDMLDNEAAEPKALPLSLLAEITNGFSDKLEIGRGGFAVVYKAMLENGDVAVKRLMSDAHMYENEFHREVECLMKVKHKNIVRFLGYCADTQGNVGSYNGKFVMADVQQRLLCFEYLPNGSLQDYITDASDGLEWKERYKIIKGICEGLHYLHQINILHLDLKPANILLDENMIPKITDFGLSRCFDQEQTRVITTKVSGTIGYLAPEFTSHEITHKFDLYSLGTIITEILTGKRGYQPVENVLENWSNRLGISPENPQWKQIQVCAEIGIKCTKFNPAKRPDSMLQIVNRLVETEGVEVIQAAEPKELFDVHPLELCFPFESNKKIPCSLHLTNNTKEHVAFRLMVPVNQYNYYFEKLPLYGIVPPRSTYTLVVTMEGRESQLRKGIDLILERITLGDEHIHTYQSQPEKFIEKSKDMGNVVHAVTLKVVSALPREITTSSPSKPISPEIKILSTGDWCYSLDTNHAKQWIITGQSYGHVRIWNSQTKQILDSFKVSDAIVTCVKFIARKQWFVAGMDNGLIHVYEYCETKMRKIISFRTSQRNVHSLAVHPTQPYLLSSHNTEMKLWDWDKGWECTQTFENEHSNTILHVAFNPKDTIASASEDHRVKVWSLNSPISRHNFSEHSNKVNCLDFFTCYDQEYLVTASDDQTAKIWDMQKKICVRTLETFTSPVTSVLYQPKLQILITGSEDGSVYLWNTTSSRINSRSPRLERIVNIGCDGGVHSLAYLMGRVVIGQNFAVAIMDIDNSLNNLEQSTDEYSEPLSSAYNDTMRPATDTTCKVISSSSSSTSELLAVALELIRFPCEPNKSKSWSLHLTNNTDEHVAFRLIGKSSGSIAPFTELPLYGIVPSRSSYTLVVSTTKEVLTRSTETGFDAILQSSTSGNKYATLFRNEDECHDFFGEAKEMGNDVHEVAVLLKVDCHVPQSEETNSKPALIPPRMQITSIKNPDEELCSLDAHPTEPWIITGHANGEVRSCNHGTQGPTDTFKVSEQSVSAIKFIARKKWIVAGTSDGFIHVYNCFRVTQIRKIKKFRDDNSSVDSLAVHPTEQYVLSRSRKLWDWSKGWECTQDFLGGSIRHVAFNPEDANNFASAGIEGVVEVRSLDSLDHYTMSGHWERVNCLDFFTRDDGQYLITGSEDCTAKIWDLQKKACIHTMEAIMSPVISAISLPGHPYLVTGSQHGTVQVWSSTDFRLIRTVNFCGGGPVRGLVGLMGSRRVAIGQKKALSVMEIDGEEAVASEGNN